MNAAHILNFLVLLKLTFGVPVENLEDYTVRQINFILDDILFALKDFVTEVLEAKTEPSRGQRDGLKSYLEALNQAVKDEGTGARAGAEQSYENTMRKFAFLDGHPTKQLRQSLPLEWHVEYEQHELEIAKWLNRTAASMGTVFNRHYSAEEQPLRHQYFNDAFDDMLRAPRINQKLSILADILKVVKNKKQISILDLYMQTL